MILFREIEKISVFSQGRMAVMALLIAFGPSISKAAEHIVDIPGIRFASPEFVKDEKENVQVLKVKMGDIVKFKNTSTVPHMVNTFHPDLMWNLGFQKPDAVLAVRPPKKPTRMEILCGYHADMKMILEYQK